jgi:hypothetical protein
MTDAEFQQAVTTSVASWATQRLGTPLRPVPFSDAIESKCHDNAASYVALHGGEVVHGFLILRPANWPTVYVYAHSVVRTTEGEMVDPSLTVEKLRAHAFFPLQAEVADFKASALRHPQETRPVPSLGGVQG